MKQAWRWFGPKDPVSLDDIRQAGATDIVTALHDFAPGQVWTRKAVAERKSIIETTPPGRTPLAWSVVESIPVPDDVKRKGKAARQSIEGWIESLSAVAAEGVRTVCYNFMPVLDWTRTDLDWPLPTGATALRFDNDRFAAFDLYILKRPGAERDWDDASKARARTVLDGMSQDEVDTLTRTLAAGLPGTTTDALDLDAFRARIAEYAGMDAAAARRHAIEFLEEVAPVAQSLGVRLTLHPDDPPRPLLGLPRIASTAEDYAALFDAVPVEANGMCFCTGSLGVRPDNDLVGIIERFGPRIGFVHLRATKREADPLSFHEAAHLDGDVDMVAVIAALTKVNRSRKPGDAIPFRPDHGHRMLDDLSKVTNPGYSAIGRLKGLAELRGIMRAVEQLA
jgi:mannonate dehydratase